MHSACRSEASFQNAMGMLVDQPSQKSRFSLRRSRVISHSKPPLVHRFAVLRAKHGFIATSLSKWE